jgi:hypothetical protein
MRSSVVIETNGYKDLSKQVNFMHTAFGFWFHLPDIQRRGTFPFGLAVFLAVVAIVGVGVLYAKEAGRLGVLARALMASVRMALIGVVAFLLLRPVLVTELRENKLRPIAVLIDVSKSMDARDGLPSDSLAALQNKIDRPTRIEIAKKALSDKKIDLFNRLFIKTGPLEVYTFGLSLTGRDWTDPDKWLDKLEANENETALVKSAFDLLNRDDSDAPSALVLVTDGRDNASNKSLDDLARECARRKIPIYVYGVGSSSFSQLQLKDVIVPEVIFVDDLVSVPVRYTVKGIKDGKVEIVLLHGGEEVARKEIPVQEKDDLRETLSFVPTKELADPHRKQELTAKITITTGNGTQVATLTDELIRPAQIVDKKIKVLVIDSLPRFDFKYLQRALQRDRRVEAKFYLTEGDKAAMRSGSPWMIEFSRELNGTLNMEREEFRKTIFDFDLLILGAIPGKYFNLEQQQIIRDFVTEGGGLIHIAGRSYTDRPDKWTAPAAWAGEWEERNDKGETRLVATKPASPLGELLPVEFKAERMPIQNIGPPPPFVPVPAPGAVRSPIISLDDDPLENSELWGKIGNQNGFASDKQLKPLYWYYPVLKTKPASDVFLVHPTDHTPRPDNKQMPLLVGHFFGKGYVLFVGFDDTWRWRFNSAETLFGRFWSQAIYIAGLPRTLGTKLTQLSIDNPDPILGATGQIYARVFNENYKLLTADEIDATLVRLDADSNDKDRSTTIKLLKLSGQDGEYIATLPFNKVGRFQLSVDPKNKTPATLEYRVNYPPNHEQAPGGLAEEAMRKLCDATGGKFYREDDLHELPNDVKSQSTVSEVKRERLLWNVWAMAALIGLFTLEWVLRKFNGLS